MIDQNFDNEQELPGGRATGPKYIRRLTSYQLPTGGGKSKEIRLEVLDPEYPDSPDEPIKIVGPSPAQLAKGFARSAAQAVRNGGVAPEIREQRLETCRACPFFNAPSKTCGKCGCFMEIKSWIGGDPNSLCPDKRWKQ